MDSEEKIRQDLTNALIEYYSQEQVYGQSRPESYEQFKARLDKKIRCYSHSNFELSELLRKLYWRITTKLLKEKQIPQNLWPEVLLAIPGHPGLKSDELPGDFESLPAGAQDLLKRGTPAMLGFLPAPNLPPIELCRSLSPEERSNKLAAEWVYCAGKQASVFIDIQWSRINKELNYVPAGQPTEEAIKKTGDRLAMSQRLARLGYDWDEIVQYYMLENGGFTYDDVSHWFSDIGRVKSPEAVRKDYKRQQEQIKNVIRLELAGEISRDYKDNS